jgi:hypothetical protein
VWREISGRRETATRMVLSFNGPLTQAGTGEGMAVLLTSLTPMGAMFQSQYTMFTSTTNPDTRGYGRGDGSAAHLFDADGRHVPVPVHHVHVHHQPRHARVRGTGEGMAVLLTSLTPMGAMFQSQYTMFTSTSSY